MSTNHTPGEQRELDAVQDELTQAKKSTNARYKKVDDLTSRFQDLRRRNHFRLMLEDLFNN